MQLLVDETVGSGGRQGQASLGLWGGKIIAKLSSQSHSFAPVSHCFAHWLARSRVEWSGRSFVPWGPYRMYVVSSRHHPDHSHFPLLRGPLTHPILIYLRYQSRTKKKKRALTQRIQWQPILIYSIFIEAEQKIPRARGRSQFFLVLLS